MNGSWPSPNIKTWINPQHQPWPWHVPWHQYVPCLCQWGTSVVYQCFISVLNGSSHSGMIQMIPSLLGEWITPITVGFMGVISKQHTWRVAWKTVRYGRKRWQQKYHEHMNHANLLLQFAVLASLNMSSVFSTRYFGDQHHGSPKQPISLGPRPPPKKTWGKPWSLLSNLRVW
jgi:hypothetical protein